MKKTCLLPVVLLVTVFVSCLQQSEAPYRCPYADEGQDPGPMLGMLVPDMQREAYHRGKIVSVNPVDYRGKWLVLFFYPADFTFVCPTELKELSDYYQEFVSLKAEILAVSTDSVYVHRAWQKNTETLKDVVYPMVSDRPGDLSRYFRAYNKKEGISERATFLVDPEGHVVAYEFHHESVGRSADELLRKLNAAIAVREGGGGYCPAGWKPGDNVLHPE